MTFLEICQRLRLECEIPGSGPTAVTGQSRELTRVISWAASAWEDIQNDRQTWRWMRRPFSLNTVVDTDSYAPTAATDVDAGAAISRFARWLVDDPEDPPLAYLQSAGVAQQFRLNWLPWEHWKWLYRFGTQNATQPIHVAVDPQNKLCLGPKPNGIYVVTGDFQRSIQVLSANGHIPEMPTQFHMLVVYHAMTKYGANSVAPEILARGQLEATRLLGALEMDQLPMLSTGGPLV